MKPFSSVLILLVFLFLPAAAAQSEEPLRINNSIKPPFSTKDETGFLDILVRELFGRLGLKVEFIRLPPERALMFANTGKSDGELPRIAGLEKKYPNLIRVPEKVLDYNFVSYSRGRCKDGGWESLSGRSVGYIIGWKIFEKNVPETAQSLRLTAPLQLFTLLARNRVDTVLYERHAGHYILKNKGFTGITECGEPLAVKPMYLYLHKSRSGLVAKAAEALREMKRDGTYESIFKKTLMGE